MNQYFEPFIKDHLNDILCQVERDHALKFLLRPRVEKHKVDAHRHPHAHTHHTSLSDVELQDCAISPTVSISHL